MLLNNLFIINNLNFVIPGTYQNPLKNRKMSINQNDVAKVDMTVDRKERHNAGAIIFFLPRVSAIKPQKCDDKIIPM